MKFDNNIGNNGDFDFRKLGRPLWDFENPLAEKVMGGIRYKITDECKVVNQGTPGAYKLYSLYQGYVYIGDFRKVDEAKQCAEKLARAILN